MDFSPENPIQLVVKAPNQRIADQTVDCMLDWTVKKLKQHLENVYPSKPRKDQQKLIYSGKLLSDHLTLKEILRQFDSEVKHTLHLVCSPTTTSSPSEQHQSSVNTTSPSREAVSSPDSMEGLRFRGHNATESSQNTYSTVTSSQQMPFPQIPVPPMPPTVMPGMPQMYPQGHNMQNYTPEQYMWMQQMYMQQYYAQYMQYYQSVATSSTNVPISQENIVQPNIQNQMNVAPPEQLQQQQRNVDQPIRMNAQGGPVIDDDDELGQWDWLDWVYALCRFMVLISIVYFYSTLNRFMIVVLFFFIVYLLRAEWFRVRQPNRRAAQNPEAAAPPQPEEPRQQPEGEQRAENNSQNNENEETDESSEATATEESRTQEPPRPSTLSIIWSFISTFFTSLIPQPPPPVNAN